MTRAMMVVMVMIFVMRVPMWPRRRRASFMVMVVGRGPITVVMMVVVMWGRRVFTVLFGMMMMLFTIFVKSFFHFFDKSGQVFSENFYHNFFKDIFVLTFELLSSFWELWWLLLLLFLLLFDHFRLARPLDHGRLADGDIIKEILFNGDAVRTAIIDDFGWETLAQVWFLINHNEYFDILFGAT